MITSIGTHRHIITEEKTMWDLETNEYDDIKEIATEQGIDTASNKEEDTDE